MIAGRQWSVGLRHRRVHQFTPQEPSQVVKQRIEGQRDRRVGVDVLLGGEAAFDQVDETVAGIHTGRAEPFDESSTCGIALARRPPRA